MVLPTETLVGVFGFLDYKTSAKLLIVSKRCNATLTQLMVMQAGNQHLNYANVSIFDFTFILEEKMTSDEERPIIISSLRRVKQLKEAFEQHNRWSKSRQTTLS
uniref:F-box domain-containing protein n=1 Tax=Ditylenchus dipsaci TaxID=166011 RepID=A0A915EAL9_9BILA